MANPTKRLIWLIETLERYGRMTPAEIDAAWSRAALNDNNESRLPRRTLQNQICQIKDIFNVTIKCDRSDGCYYIADVDTISQNLIQSLVISQMTNYLDDVSSRVTVGLSDYYNRSVLVVMDAMREKKTISITKTHGYYTDDEEAFLIKKYPQYSEYLKDGEITISTELHPYFLDYADQFMGWCVIGYVPERDRIEVHKLHYATVSPTKNIFIMPEGLSLDSIKRKYFLYIKSSDLDLYDDRVEYSNTILAWGTNIELTDEEYEKVIDFQDS